MDMPTSSSHDRTAPGADWSHRLRRGIVLVLGLAISLALAATADRMLRQEAVAQRALASQSLIAGLQGHLDRELDLLAALRGLFEASELVTAEEFARFAELDHHVKERSPWVKVGWVARAGNVAPASNPATLADALAGPMAAEYLTPQVAGDALAGFDLTGNPASLAAMRRAFETRAVAVSEATDQSALVGASPAVLAFEPVFKTPRGGTAPEFLGFVLGAFALDGLIGSHLDNSLPEGGLDIEVRDGTAAIFARGAAAPNAELLPLRMGDRTWRIMVSPRVSSLQSTVWVPALVFLFGLAVTILLYLHLQRIDSEYGRISSEVQAATRELAEANQSLAERSAALQDLAEDLRRTSAEAQLANSAKTMFLANMSHELRTPLNAMIGFSEIISRRIFGAEVDRYTDYARDIHSSGLHLLSIIEDLLDMSRIELGTFKLEPVPAKPAQLVADVLRLLRHRAQEQNVAIRCEGLDALPEMQLDPRAMRQALINLLSNAIKFSAAGTTVVVSGSRTPHGDVLLSVTDQGVGIAAEQLPQIFDPFWQSDATRRQARGGVGLGLAITRRLIEAHDGSVTARSKVNAGTTMVIFLPASRVLEHRQEGLRSA